MPPRPKADRTALEGKIDHHDRVLLDDAHQHHDADHGDDRKIHLEHDQHDQRADAGRRQAGDDGSVGSVTAGPRTALGSTRRLQVGPDRPACAWTSRWPSTSGNREGPQERGQFRGRLRKFSRRAGQRKGPFATALTLALGVAQASSALALFVANSSDFDRFG